MTKAQEIVRKALGIEATARLKTVGTIVDKLRRERTSLPRMQDIAGLRIVEEMGPKAQDQIVERLVELFPGAKVTDRRATPTFGYRAVHVIAKVDGFLVEIQVRTIMQDLWAQIIERLADVAGRGIRYGDVPAPYKEKMSALIGLSELIGKQENQTDRINSMDATPAYKMATAQREQRIVLRQLESLKRSNKELASTMRTRLTDLLTSIVPESR